MKQVINSLIYKNYIINYTYKAYASARIKIQGKKMVTRIILIIKKRGLKEGFMLL